MLGYYLDLAVRSLKRNKVLTALMVLTLGLGIGASMTTLTLLRLLSGDPLPGKSGQLFYPQLDPTPKDGYIEGQTKPQPMMTYTDAMALLRAGKAKRQAVIALTEAKVQPLKAGDRPFYGDGVMTTADFFDMFEVPFRYGSGWTSRDDTARADLVVISEELNGKLFGGENSVGRTIRISEHDFRIVGVLKHWTPQPRFYALELGGRSYGGQDDIFLPLDAARAAKFSQQNSNCYAQIEDISKLETAPCMWLGFWVQLDSAAAQASYRQFLQGYVQQQLASGRFQRPNWSMLDLKAWLREDGVVPDDVRLQASLASGFLLICVLNTVGLLLAKCLRRSSEIGVRRALGATRGAVFAQFMVEAGIVGLVGGLLGLIFTELGLWAIRHQPAQYAGLARLDLPMFAVTFAVALLASLIAGLLPAWRACVLAPAPQLKSA